MFANNNLGVLNFAFPDVCQIVTPVGTVPLPLVNLAFSTKFHGPPRKTTSLRHAHAAQVIGTDKALLAAERATLALEAI